MQPLSGNQRPDLLTSLMNMSRVMRLPREMHLSRSCSNAPRLPSFLNMLQSPHVLLTFDKVHNPVRLPRETTSERPKVVRACGAFKMLTSKCASRHNGVHFFDIPTAKSTQQWSGAGVLCIFWLRHVLRATTACTFSTSQLPKVVRSWCALYFDMCFARRRRALFRHLNCQKYPTVVRSWCALYIWTSKCASRHNGVHFFDISTAKSGPELVCVVYVDFEMCFAPQRRAHFRHLHFQKWSGAGVFCTFWLRSVLRTTTPCTFSTSQLQKMLGTWSAFSFFTASRHNGVPPAALASLLFDPPGSGATNIPVCTPTWGTVLEKIGLKLWPLTFERGFRALNSWLLTSEAEPKSHFQPPFLSFLC